MALPTRGVPTCIAAWGWNSSPNTKAIRLTRPTSPLGKCKRIGNPSNPHKTCHFHTWYLLISSRYFVQNGASKWLFDAHKFQDATNLAEMHKLIGPSPGLQPEGSQCTPSERVLLLPIEDSSLPRAKYRCSYLPSPCLPAFEIFKPTSCNKPGNPHQGRRAPKGMKHGMS